MRGLSPNPRNSDACLPLVEVRRFRARPSRHLLLLLVYGGTKGGLSNNGRDYRLSNSSTYRPGTRRRECERARDIFALDFTLLSNVGGNGARTRKRDVERRVVKTTTLPFWFSCTPYSRSTLHGPDSCQPRRIGTVAKIKTKQSLASELVGRRRLLLRHFYPSPCPRCPIRHDTPRIPPWTRPTLP